MGTELAGTMDNNKGVNKKPRIATVQDSHEKNKSVAYTMLAIEAIIISFLALIFALGARIEIAISIVLGGMVFIIPNAYFAKNVFRHSAADSPHLAVRWFYVGEIIKLLATVLIFTFCFLFIKKLNVPILILTYAVMLILNLLGNSIFMNHQTDMTAELD